LALGEEGPVDKKTNIGKGTQDLRDIPQSVTVMTEKLIDDAKLDTLKEALHYTAGITFSATENGTDQDIRIRGFPLATTGDLMIDGMRDPSQYERDTFNLERIEVMRGSASMLFGRGSTGGVINQVTKKPLLADQTDVMAPAGTGGFFRTTGRLQQAHRRGVGAAHQRDVHQGGQRRREHRAQRHRAELQLGPGHGGRVHRRPVPHQQQQRAAHVPSRTSTASWRRSTRASFYGTSSDYVDGDATMASFAHTHRFADGGELRSQLRSGTFDRAQWSSVARFGVRPTAPTTRRTSADPSTILTRGSLTPRKDPTTRPTSRATTATSTGSA
jgi:catecholate siderophore receptor